jgi:plastocyanin
MDRDSRILLHSKGYKPIIVRGKPLPSEGSNGDIALGNTSAGVKLFIKIGNRWNTFSPDKDEKKESNVVNFKPTSDGAPATPSRILKPSETGKTFVVDVSANTAVFKLPSVTVSLGVTYKFIMSEESNGENSKDFIVITSSISEDMMGPFHTSSATSGLGPSRSIVQFDSSDNAISAGDFIEFTCDGKAWYVFGVTFLDNIDGADDYTVSSD